MNERANAQSTRRTFLGAAAVCATFGAASIATADDTKVIPGFEEPPVDPDASRGWQPASDRKIRVGIAGYGVCRFGAAFGFQDHPNVEVTAVTDLIPQRCEALAKACRCSRTFESCEKLLDDDSIEAVFVAIRPMIAMSVLRHMYSPLSIDLPERMLSTNAICSS
jgi:hypothetical protein